MASSTITVNGTDVSLKDNIALGKNVKVSSSENPSVDGSKIVDNDGTTRWSSEFTDNQYCQIDLGKNYTINKVTFNWEASYAKEYKIQVSKDGNNWTTVYENNNGKGGEESIVFDATECRYVKMQGVKRALAYGYSLWEMGVYEATKVETPIFSIPSGTYSKALNVNISSNTKGVEIRYTTDGSTPNEKSNLYVPSIKISKNTTLKAIAYRKGMIDSSVATAEYKIDGSSTEPEQPTTPDTSETKIISTGCKTVTSGSENDVFGGKNAVDGDKGTRWSSNFADDAWIYVDLGKTYSVNKVVLTWEGAYGKAYKIQTSTDGKTWKTVKNVTNGKGEEETVAFNSTDARYVRMQGVERALPYGYSLWEMEVYGKVSGSASDGSNNEDSSVPSDTNVAKSAKTTSSGNETDAMAAKYAVDGDNGTRWSSNFVDDAWLLVDLGKAYTINKVVLNWEGAYGKAYKIQTSTDGKNWTTVKNVTDGKGGEETITFDATKARYVRMQGVERALPYGYSLWEMSVYTK